MGVVVEDVRELIFEFSHDLPEGWYVRGTLVEVIRGQRPGRENPEQNSVFTSTGLAIQDLATARVVYQAALAQGIGLKIALA